MSVSTKSDLLATWIRWTGDPIREARHRIRVLSEDGQLPRRSGELTYDDLARAILGFLVSDTHKGAAAETRRFSGFQCGAWEPGGDDEIAAGTLLQAISRALKPPFSIVSISVSPTTASLRMIKGGDRFSNTEYGFNDAQTLFFLPKTVYPVVMTKSVQADLIQHLTGLMHNEPENETAAALPGAAAAVRDQDQDRDNDPVDTHTLEDRAEDRRPQARSDGPGRPSPPARSHDDADPKPESRLDCSSTA